MPSLTSRLCAIACALFISGTALAQTVELAGVKYANAIKLGDKTLQLNGAGIRYKFVAKVYTAGLYLDKKVGTPEAVLAAGGAKRVHVVMLRDIDGNELGKLFTRGMRDNASREEFSKSIPGTLQLAEVFAMRKKLHAGDVFMLDYQPSVGTQLVVNGKPQGAAVKEPEFFTALLSIWLGASPADRLLKEALLGRPVDEAQVAQAGQSGQ
jgi:Chalcone isomerase-like